MQHSIRPVLAALLVLSSSAFAAHTYHQPDCYSGTLDTWTNEYGKPVAIRTWCSSSITKPSHTVYMVEIHIDNRYSGIGWVCHYPAARTRLIDWILDARYATDNVGERRFVNRRLFMDAPCAIKTY